MSGPIIRTGATPKFWQNWDQIFDKKAKSKAKGTSGSKATEAAPAGKAASKKTATAKAPASTAKKATAGKAAGNKATRKPKNP